MGYSSTMDEYKTRHIQRYYDISYETVRAWAEEFKEYLSPLANPGEGRHRVFSDNDLRVFSLVREMKETGSTFSDIHASLKSGIRGKLPEIGFDDEVVEELAIAQTNRTVNQLTFERDEAVKELQTVKDELIKIRTQLEMKETSESELKGRLQQAQERIEKLLQEKTRLEVMLEMSRERKE
jgi:DNA-binding transcriptional MerR regulator